MKWHLILFRWDRMPWDLWTHSRNCIASDALGREGILWRQSSPSPSPPPRPPSSPAPTISAYFFLVFFLLFVLSMLVFSYFHILAIVSLSFFVLLQYSFECIILYSSLFLSILYHFSHFLSNLEHHYLHYTCPYIQNIQIHVQRQFTRTHPRKLQWEKYNTF